ncbi:MAG: hypothetical protein ACYC0T_21765 [Ramlibacter sp.]
MTETEYKILLHLKNHHRSSERAITYKKLSIELGINSRELRLCVSQMVTDGALIASSQEGYWWISNDEEYQLAHDELISRIKKLSRRAKGLRTGYKLKQEIKPKQLQFI